MDLKYFRLACCVGLVLLSAFVGMTSAKMWYGGEDGGVDFMKIRDGDGISDIDEMLAGTYLDDPCNPNQECAACLAIRSPTPTPTPTPVITPTPTPTPTPVPAEIAQLVLRWFWILIALITAALIVSVAYMLRRGP